MITPSNSKNLFLAENSLTINLSPPLDQNLTLIGSVDEKEDTHKYPQMRLKE